jgi:CRISPR-associated protein Cmr6
MRNLHQAYYKDYFKGLDFRYLVDERFDQPKSEIKQRNDDLTSANLLKVIVRPPIVNCFLPLQISYPGLITGIGINHEAKIEGEFKLGVHFDWTWGMPVVYGSSVKGVMRSAFIAKVEKGIIVEYDDCFLKKVIPEYEWDQESIRVLFDSIFEGKKSDGKNLSIYERDIFFDAVIVEADPKGRILCSDSITPHGDSPLKNPTPLTFMKIAPGCKMEFRFKLHNSDLGGGKIFTAAQKKTLFEEILKTVGVGAKTNVGYGQLK